MLKEFKQFISRGNVLDLAIGVLIGSAFSSIVTSLTKNLLNPFIGLFLGKVDLSNIQFSIAGANFLVGQFLNDVIAFLITAFVVFLIAKFFNSLRKKKKKKNQKLLQNQVKKKFTYKKFATCWNNKTNNINKKKLTEKTQ